MFVLKFKQVRYSNKLKLNVNDIQQTNYSLGIQTVTQTPINILETMAGQDISQQNSTEESTHK
mgnify:CR=1 FL=1